MWEKNKRAEASAAGEGHGMASEKTEQGESSLPEVKTSEELSFSNEVQSIYVGCPFHARVQVRPVQRH